MGNWDSWLNRSTTTESFIDLSQAQKLEATLDRTPTLKNGDHLPPAWHWLYFHELSKASDLGRDGHTKLGINLPEFTLPRRMWAGGKINWLAPLLIGSLATKVSKILSIEEKSGRTGDLIFVTVQHEVSQNGSLCISEEQNIVYRAEATQSKANEAEQAQSDSDFSMNWQLNETALFRYSALTFNGHRIHYDVEYAKNIEGYAGLIVHGPLLATLMLDMAKQNNRPMNTFSYRAKSPITLPNEFSTNGLVTGNETTLWVANQNGGLAMQATLS